MDPLEWQQIRNRYEAWWHRELLDRSLVCLTAPSDLSASADVPSSPHELLRWFTDPALVLPRLERQVAGTYWAGDAFPVVFPMATAIPAIEAAYLGAPCRLLPDGPTGWCEPTIDDWGDPPTLAVDPDDLWWKATQRLLEEAAQHSHGRYAVGIPDLQGGGQILASLRGPERLALDLIDRPEVIRPALEAINAAWYHYYRTCFDIIHNASDVPRGYVDWLGVWSDSPAVTVECDFAALISPRMFREFFLPALEQQIEWVGRTIFHLDGPQSLPHLDTLLSLPGLDGIQWVPGAGAAPMREWIPLLAHIQRAGKLVVATCEPYEVLPILEALGSEGVLLTASCASPAEAEELLRAVGRRFGCG